MRFADSKGWEYTVREPQLSPRIRSKRFLGYADNFSHKRAGIPVGGFISVGFCRHQPMRADAHSGVRTRRLFLDAGAGDQ